MYILTVSSIDKYGAFSVENSFGEKVLFIFEEYDDAQRYLSMLEELNYPEMEITEVLPEVALEACEFLGYRYIIITPEDIVVPPDYDKVSQFKI